MGAMHACPCPFTIASPLQTPLGPRARHILPHACAGAAHHRRAPQRARPPPPPPPQGTLEVLPELRAAWRPAALTLSFPSRAGPGSREKHMEPGQWVPAGARALSPGPPRAFAEAQLVPSAAECGGNSRAHSEKQGQARAQAGCVDSEH